MSGLAFETSTTQSFLLASSCRCSSVTIELEGRDAPFGGLLNELLTSEAKQLVCLSA